MVPKEVNYFSSVYFVFFSLKGKPLHSQLTHDGYSTWSGFIICPIGFFLQLKKRKN